MKRKVARKQCASNHICKEAQRDLIAVATITVLDLTLWLIYLVNSALCVLRNSLIISFKHQNYKWFNGSEFNAVFWLTFMVFPGNFLYRCAFRDVPIHFDLYTFRLLILVKTSYSAIFIYDWFGSCIYFIASNRRLIRILELHVKTMWFAVICKGALLVLRNHCLFYIFTVFFSFLNIILKVIKIIMFQMLLCPFSVFPIVLLREWQK